MQHAQTFIPAKAGTHFSTGKLFPTWPEFRDALRKALCLADPWIPAFAGTVLEK
jgi:hypothetical protein